jgi:hypothetical protein
VYCIASLRLVCVCAALDLIHDVPCCRSDTRRSAAGLGGFRLTYPPLDFWNDSNPRVGYRFADVVALGNYNGE